MPSRTTGSASARCAAVSFIAAPTNPSRTKDRCKMGRSAGGGRCGQRCLLLYVERYIARDAAESLACRRELDVRQGTEQDHTNEENFCEAPPCADYRDNACFPHRSHIVESTRSTALRIVPHSGHLHSLSDRPVPPVAVRPYTNRAAMLTSSRPA